MPPSMAAKMAAATTQARFGETFLFAVEIPRGRLRETERPGIEVIQEQTSAGRESDSMRILVVEDDKKIASFVIKGLKQNGFAVDHAVNDEDGRRFDDEPSRARSASRQSEDRFAGARIFVARIPDAQRRQSRFQSADSRTRVGLQL